MALSEGERAMIRQMAFDVCKEWTKVHTETCPHGKLLCEMHARLTGIKWGIAIGLFLAGSGLGVGLAKLLGV